MGRPLPLNHARIGCVKVVATSDLHGRFPKIPECDVLIIAGDVSPLEFDRDLDLVERWLYEQFGEWLAMQPAKHVIGVAGNHDFIFEQRPDTALGLPWFYLLDEPLWLDGVTFWGTPWVAHLAGWAFYKDREGLAEAYAKVPNDIDVVISHGPPMGHVSNNLHREWCSSSVNDMLKRVKPKHFVCGHIHEGYGIERGYRKTTNLYNVSYCDVLYGPVNAPIVFHI